MKLIAILLLGIMLASCGREETKSMVQFRGKTVDHVTEGLYSFEIFFTDSTSLELWSYESVICKTAKNKK